MEFEHTKAKQGKKESTSTNATRGNEEKETSGGSNIKRDNLKPKVRIGESDGAGGGGSSSKGIFVSIKSINISGSDPDLRRGSSSSPSDNFLLRGSYTSDRDKISSKFNIPDIKSETRVLVPRVCSDSHIGEGEGFHSSRLSSSASHGSLSSALLVVGITSSSSNANNSSSKNPLTSIPSEGARECDSEIESQKVAVGGGGEEEDEQTDKTIEPENVFEPSGDGDGSTREKVVADLDVFLDSVGGEDVEDTDLSIQGLHDISVANTEDFLDDEEELLEEYDEPDDELHRELEKVFDSEIVSGGGCGIRNSRGGPSKISKFRDSATWTQEDDMPSPLSDLSPVHSPRKSGKSSSRGSGGGGGHHHPSQFDHQYQYHPQTHQVYLRDRESSSGGRHSHNLAPNSSSGGPSSSRNSRSHHSTSRGIHQSQSNQRNTGGGAGGTSSVVGEFIHHQPQQHHQPTECFTVSSQLLSREARLYENVPTTQGELETLEILLAGEGCNYPTSGGSAGASNTSKASSSQTSKTQSSGINSSSKNNAGSGSGGGRESTGSSANSNHHHSNHNLLLHHHHHSATNLNLVPSPTTTANSVEQLFSVSELLGPGSCLAVGGGPPSRTSWVDSGRESLSFDGENNNSGGSTRNLLLIPPPPPPPINYQGFVPNSIIMQAQKHHHQQLQHSPSHSQGSSRKTGSRRERLVRQKEAIDETFLPIPTNSDMKLGMEGQVGGGGGYLAVPSPRRGVIPGNVIASNFTAAASSPISLQRHPPPSQIMLQENKKNRPLIPCDSPYGIMSGPGLGLGTGGTGDWTFGRSSDKKGSQMTRDLLRCRSPQRGRSSRSKGHNQSFDYGELPSHQMFPKRHLLTNRQLSSHHQQQHQGYPTVDNSSTTGTTNGANGSNPNASNVNANSPFLLHPHNHHRSFPAGLFR
jgi:hypothetical protein